MTEIAHRAIDAGADFVLGHGPHFSLPVAVYKGKPIFYGLGSFSFHTGHGGRRHPDWVGMLARIEASRRGVEGATIQFVRHNDRNETFLCKLADEAEALAELTMASAPFGTTLTTEGDRVRVGLKAQRAEADSTSASS
jgi:poly-gamma-glutamate capsule biosynthesis protein CapA/YwtB (metallophosphatase superfamily)